MRDDELFRLAGCQAIAETTAGLRVLLPSGRCVWLPKSQIHEDSEVYALETSGILVVPAWLAAAEDLDA